MTTTPTSPRDVEQPYGLAARMILAALSLAAGAIHLAMVPIHAPASATEAIAFAVAGWLQILTGIALAVRPTRSLLLATIALNAGVLVAYVISRTVGLPFGANPGEAEGVEAADLMVTIFEALIIIGAGALLAWPSLGTEQSERGVLSWQSAAVLAAIPLLVLVATSAVLADPDLVTHSHDDGGAVALASAGGHTHGAATDSAALAAHLSTLASDRCDLGFNPAAYWRESAMSGVDTLMGGEAATTDHSAAAAVRGSAQLDEIISKQMTSEGELGDAAMVVALAGVTDEVYDDWLRWLAASGLMNHSHDSSASTIAPDDNQGMGGHLGPQSWHAMTDAGECAALEAELALARDTALKYPTVKDAEAAGWIQVTPYVPGIAAHFMNFGLVDGTFEIDKPEMILYDGTDDDSRVVGLSYYLRHPGKAEPTQGFTGINDHYHRHDGLCVNGSGVIGDSTTTEEECAARGGRKSDGTSGWMSHAWVVPGCESPWGVFSGASPVLDTELTKNTGSAGGCAGSGVLARYNLTPGDRENTPTEVGGNVELVVGR